MSIFSKIIIGFAFLFVSGMLVGLIQDKESNLPIVSNSKASKITSLEFELDALRKQYANDLVKFAGVLPQHSSKTTSSISGLQSEASSAFASKIRQDLIAEVERIKEIYKKDPQFDMDTARQKIFESEPIDSVWATPREEAISQAFKNISNLQDKSVKSIQCRSKWCRIEIFYQNTSEAVPIAEKVYDLTRHEKYGELFSVGGDMSTSLKDKVVSIYLNSDPSVSFF